MVYENTHLWAAEKAGRQISDNPIKQIITARIDHFHLGAIFPDTLFYSKASGRREIAELLHGSGGVPTNQFVFRLLGRARRSQDDKCLAFVFGYLTHMAMDMVFHPAVFYYSGYKSHGSADQMADSQYLHWHYETAIDRHFNDTVSLDRVIRPAVLEDLDIASVLDLSPKDILDSLERQMAFFKRNHSRALHMACRILAGLGLVEKKIVAGFYANLDTEPRQLPQKLRYKDIISGENREDTLDALMDRGIARGLRMIGSAYEYYCRKIDRTACERVVVGDSLDTGRPGKTRKDIRFSINSSD